MNSHGDVMSLMDLLDFDEEIVDSRLKSIMLRSTHTNQHLTNALQLLKYKNLINIQEKTECNNAEEFDFVAKLIKDISGDIVRNVCKITSAVLDLNPTTLVSYSEHLLSQILSNLDLSNIGAKFTEPEQSNTLLYLKVCDSVLDSAISHGEKLDMRFLENSLEEILSSHNEQLKLHFITCTVPKLAEGVNGYDILTRIWTYLEQLKGENRANALKVLSSLSDYYLPVSTNEKSAKYESTLVFNENFWDIVLYGLMSDDPLLRKISVYLAKRAIDYIASLKINVDVKLQDQTLFIWEHKKQDQYRMQWDNFFILIDSLEEKQSNIVLPSLKLFDSFTNIGNSWLNCAFNLGLKHDNGQVRLKCIEYRIKSNINNVPEAIVLLSALNDINFYDNKEECRFLKEKLSELLKNKSNLIYTLEAIPQAHLSPVPFYHLTDIITNLNINIDSNEHKNMAQIITEVLKTSCNIIAIREAIHFNIAHFIGKSCKNIHWRDLLNIHALLQLEKITEKNAFCDLIKEWKLNECDKLEFLEHVTESHNNIEFSMLYLNSHLDDIDSFMKMMYRKGKAIQDIINRQYSNKSDCLNDVLYIINLQEKCNEDMKQLLPNAHKTILQYILNLLSSDTKISIDETKLLFNRIHYDKENNLKGLILQLYKTAVIIIQDAQIDLNKMVQSLLIIESVSNNNDFVEDFSYEMIDLKQILQLEGIFEKKAVSNAQSLGRLRNTFYETHTKLVSIYLSSVIRRQKHEELLLKKDIVDKDDKKTTLNEKCGSVSCVPTNESKESMIEREKNILEKTKTENKYKLTKPIININNLNVKSTDWKEIVDYVEKVIDCGGYGCLEWILNIINETFEYTNTHLNVNQFIARIWREIDELKSSNHYLPCMKEFVILINQKSLITNPEYNNIVISYCSKIIEYGLINNSPLYFLVHNEQLSRFIEEQNDTRKLNEYGHLLYVLSEILLFCPVPRKDQRIADNLTIEIMTKSRGRGFAETKHNFNFEIQYQAISILSRIDDPDVLNALTIFMRNKIDNTFKTKFRYHGNSQIHRTLQTALQHLLFIRFLKSNVDDEEFEWCLNLLGKIPHQQSIRICLEWYIALHFYKKKTEINDDLIKLLQSKTIPISSQMVINYWLIKPVFEKYYAEEQFHAVMRMLLSHTMGQMFNVRLLAQYLAIKLHSGTNTPYNLNVEPIYDSIIEVISKTLQDNENDKNYIKLKEDYFMNDFDIIANLTPFFIYHTLPRFCDVGSNEDVRISVVLKIMDKINERLEECLDPNFKEDWVKYHVWDENLIELEKKQHVNKKTQEDLVVMGTIQKKYIPWKSMSDINVYNIEKKRESPSNLIVVASLIDKLPNLGGMARTSEVFGVKTYVIDSLRHLQDRQFQGLSVSAERWIDVEEVRPGAPLKEYLNRKKAEGYSVVAAEQTSTSAKLQNFKFPRKTLLLLGHEKEGIPCDLLPMMDHCVEIPQQGYVRSLNVHVTAAIFVWEYTRQNIL